MDNVQSSLINPFEVKNSQGRIYKVTHRPQEIEFDDPGSNNFFQCLHPDGSKPFVATAGAIRECGDRLILESYYRLVHFAKTMNGLTTCRFLTSPATRNPCGLSKTARGRYNCLTSIGVLIQRQLLFSISFQFLFMGQYFKAVNLDKREVVCPWCLKGGAKLWEWAVNRQGAIFTLLLRKSTGTGGGDYNMPGPHIIELTDESQDLAYIIGKAVAREGMPAPIPTSSIVGRWGGDRVALVGDYDEDFAWGDLEHYTNITERLVEEWNQFVEMDDAQLTFEHCGCASPLLSSPTQS